MWRWRFTLQGRWAKVIGRSAPTSTNVLTKNKLRRSVPSSPALMAAFAQLISKNLGVKKVPITYRVDGKKRSAEIPNILHMSVDPLPTMHPSGEMWANSGHPISPDKLAFAVGAPGSTFSDHGMQ